MFRQFNSNLTAVFRHATGNLSHMVIVAMSAGIALLLPVGARQFLSFWSRVEQNPMSLVAVEMTIAVLCIAAFTYLHRSRRDRMLAETALGAGLVSFFPRPGIDARRRIQTLKDEQGNGRSVMVIGSSGAGTLVDQVGDLSSILDTCLEAKILLVNPFDAQARTRIQALAHPASPYPTFREEVRQSIALLKRLKAIGKVVQLKLYADAPLVKLVIWGDYLWLQHYHANLERQTMPEYVLQRNRKEQGLYTFYAQYFLQRWESPELPEYDLDTDELVYRSRTGQEIRREPVEIGVGGATGPSGEVAHLDAHEAFRLLHAPGPYMPVRGYDAE